MEYERRKRFIINLIYCGLIFLLAYISIRYGLDLLAPFLVAFVIAYLLKKPAQFLFRKFKLPYKPIVLLFVLIFYSTIAVIISLLGVKIISSAADFISNLPAIYTTQIEPSLSSFFSMIEHAVYKMDP